MSERPKATPGHIAPLALSIRDTIDDVRGVICGLAPDKAMKIHSAKPANANAWQLNGQ